MHNHTGLNKKQLRKLPTPRLLVYHKKHYRADRMRGYKDEDPKELDLARRNYRRLVRRIMGEREHVVSKFINWNE